MTSMDDREKAFEAQYARDQEVQFRITARRNRLVGEWQRCEDGDWATWMTLTLDRTS